APEVGAHALVAAASGDDVLAAGELGSLAEDQGAARRVELVEGIAHRGIRATARGGVRFPAFARHPQLLEVALDALLLARPLEQFPGRFRRPHDRVVVAMELDAEALDRLARRGNAVDHAFGPTLLDADDDHGRHVRIAAGADQGPEMQLE